MTSFEYYSTDEGVVVSTDEHELVIEGVDEEQFRGALAKYDGGSGIEEAFYFLTPSERRFLMTGTTPEEWLRMFV